MTEEHHIDVTRVPTGALERMAHSDARPSPELAAAIDRARERHGVDIGAIESALAELLKAYADMREKYIRGDIHDYHSLDEHDRSLADEIGGIRQAAYLIRHHRDHISGMSLPSWLWDDWTVKEREISARLNELAGGAR